MNIKVAAVLWIILGVTVAGSGLIAVLSIPEFAAQSETLIPLVAGIGFTLAIPIALILSKRITAAMKLGA